MPRAIPSRSLRGRPRANLGKQCASAGMKVVRPGCRHTHLGSTRPSGSLRARPRLRRNTGSAAGSVSQCLPQLSPSNARAQSLARACPARSAGLRASASRLQRAVRRRLGAQPPLPKSTPWRASGSTDRVVESGYRNHGGSLPRVVPTRRATMWYVASHATAANAGTRNGEMPPKKPTETTSGWRSR